MRVSNPKILVLEDHPLTRQMLLLTLQGLGYSNVHTAESGESALQLLNVEKHFDVLICDILMQGIDGLTFLREACAIGNIEALIISSDIAVDLRLAIQQLARLSGYQVLGNLDKPFSKEALEKLLLHYRPCYSTLQPLEARTPPSAADIQRALANGEFVPFYQPKLNLQTLSVVGIEVLARWQHPQHGLQGPAVFLPAVQRLGALNEFTTSIAGQALHFLREQGLVGQMSLALNLEAEQLGNPGLPEVIQQLLQEAQVPASSLLLEITESGLLDAPITSIENLVRLRLMGCGVSIDDFGAGFSSLQRVCEMPCTELKLDASFTRGLAHNPRIRASVDSVLRLAANLGIQLVAEGIESSDQLNILNLLNCPIGQGFLFSRPLSGQDFMRWLQQHNSQQAAKVG